MDKSKILAVLALPALAFALLGAHYLRSGTTVGVALCALALGLLCLAPSRPWARRALQWGLLAAAFEWAWTALLLVQQRQAFGQPWWRMAAILALVALLTLGGIATLQWLASRRYRFFATRPSATSGA